MNYSKFSFTNSECLITHTRDTYFRKEGQRSWPRKAESSKDFGIMPLDHYNNFITSIPFFNNFGGRASCRASWGYTSAGYIPIEVSTVSPDGLIKHVDHFHIQSFPTYYARRDAGARELECMDHADRFTYAQDGEHRLYTFIHEDGEHSATYDAAFRKWVG